MRAPCVASEKKTDAKLLLHHISQRHDTTYGEERDASAPQWIGPLIPTTDVDIVVFMHVIGPQPVSQCPLVSLLYNY